MRILLANPRGFCAGVDRAIEIVERRARALRRRRSTCATRSCTTGTSSRSCARRARCSSTSPREAPAGALLIYSAHGVSPAVREAAARAGPAHDRRDLPARDQGARRGAALRGRRLRDRAGRPRRPRRGRGHDGPRARAHASRRGRRGRRARSRSSDPERLAVLTQTTLSVDDTREVIDGAAARASPRSGCRARTTSATRRRTARTR